MRGEFVTSGLGRSGPEPRAPRREPWAVGRGPWAVGRGQASRERARYAVGRADSSYCSTNSPSAGSG